MDHVANSTAAGRAGTVAEVEPGLYGITIEPSVGIGQRALLVRTRSGNLRWVSDWDVDDEVVAAIEEVGGLAARGQPSTCSVCRSNGRTDPAAYRLMRRQPIGQRPQRDDRVATIWDEKTAGTAGWRSIESAATFPAARLAHFVAADGRGVSPSGDTVAVQRMSTGLSMRSFPNKIPLVGGSGGKAADRVMALDFDRLTTTSAGR